MTPENPLFRKIVERYQTPDYIRTSFVKNVVGLYYALRLKPKWLNPRFREAAAKVRKPFGWRREILKRWRKTVFKELRHEKIYQQSAYQTLGNACGLLSNTTYYIEKEMSGEENEALLNVVFEPFFEGLTDDDLELYRKEADKLNAIAARIEMDALRITPSKQKEFSLGYAQSIDALFADNGKFVYQNTTTEVYQFLLAFGDLLGELRSVSEVYQFAKYVLGKEFFHSEEDFKQLCHRISFRGTSYLASRRRKRSIDRAKRRVH